MMALLRKDADWLRAFLILGTIAATGALVETRFADVWLFPIERSEKIFHTWWISAFCLGLFAAVRDELTGTREFLLHRPVSATRIHGIKLFGCGLVLIAWLTLPLILQLVGEMLARRNPGEINWSNLSDLWTIGMVVFSAFAAGLFSGTYSFGAPSRSWLWFGRIFFGGFFVCLPQTLAQLASLGDWTVFDAKTWIASHSIIAALLIAASFANIRTAPDSDFPLHRGQRLWGGGLITLTLFTMLMTTIGSLQFNTINWRASQTPDFVQFVNGDYGLADWRNRKWVAVDSDHRALGAGSRHSVTQVLWDHSKAIGGKSRPLPALFWGDAPRIHRSQRVGLFSRLADDGLFYTRRLLDGSHRSSRLRTIGRGPEHLPFSSDARIISYDDAATWVGVPGENGVWRYEASKGSAFTFVPFPDGDQLARVVQVRLDGDSPTSSLFRLSRAIVTADHVYVVDQSELTLAADEIRSQITPAKAPSRVVVDSVDALVPSIYFIDEAKGVTFRHEFAARTIPEMFMASLAIICSTLRPPAFAVTSYLSEPSATLTAEHPFVDPLLRGGRRAWLLALVLAIGAWSGYRKGRQVRRSGAAMRTQIFWIATATALGPAASLLASALHANSVGELPDLRPKPRMLICSPATQLSNQEEQIHTVQ